MPYIFTYFPFTNNPFVDTLIVLIPNRCVSLSIIFPLILQRSDPVEIRTFKDHSFGLVTVIFCLIVFVSFILSETGCSVVLPIIFPSRSVTIAQTVTVDDDKF